MKNHVSPFSVLLALGIALAFWAAPADAADWGWKKAADPTDVMNFLNAKAPYTQKIIDAEITAIDNGNSLEFIVFYVAGNTPLPTGGWAWKKSTNPDDVQNFLSGQGAYQAAVRKARVCAVWRRTTTEYYVFYRPQR